MNSTAPAPAAPRTDRSGSQTCWRRRSAAPRRGQAARARSIPAWRARPTSRRSGRRAWRAASAAACRRRKGRSQRAPARPGPRERPTSCSTVWPIRFHRWLCRQRSGAQAGTGGRARRGRRPGSDVRWPWIARRVAPDLFDDDTWHALATRNVQIARDAGALAVLPLALNYSRCCAASRASSPRPRRCSTRPTRSPIRPEHAEMVFGRVLLAGCRGDEAAGLGAVRGQQGRGDARSEGVVLTFGEHARALLYNGLGQHAAALAPAQSASARDELMVSVWSLPELMEAAVRCGRIELATAPVERLAERTQAAGTDPALGIEARARALVSEGRLTEGRFTAGNRPAQSLPVRAGPGARPPSVRGMAAP